MITKQKKLIVPRQVYNPVIPIYYWWIKQIWSFTFTTRPKDAPAKFPTKVSAPITPEPNPVLKLTLTSITNLSSSLVFYRLIVRCMGRRWRCGQRLRMCNRWQIPLNFIIHISTIPLDFLDVDITQDINDDFMIWKLKIPIV